MADAVDEKAVESSVGGVAPIDFVTSGSVDILNSAGNIVGGVTHMDIFRNPNNTYNILIKGYLVLDNESGEVCSVRDRLFFDKEEFGIRFNGRVTWWFTDPEEVIDPLMAHINFNIEDWKTESRIEIRKCKRSWVRVEKIN